jgi:hypothetical protein
MSVVTQPGKGNTDGRRLALPARNVADAAAAGRCYFTKRTGHRQKMPTL